MASINGIQLKSVKEFLGHEEEPLYQGNLYLGSKKIGWWSQDARGAIEDNVYMEDGYSEIYLRKQIVSLNKDKAIHGTSHSGSSYTIDYDLENLATDLLVLIDDEKNFKKAVKAGFGMTLVITDGYHVSTWKLPKEYSELTNEEIQKLMKKQIETSYSKMFKNEEKKIKIYRSLNDFNIGEKISIKNIER